MMRSLVAVMIIAATLSCSDATVPEMDDVRIRIGNDSESSFTNVSAIFPQDEVDYGPVAAGGYSDYRSVSVAYRFARIDVRIGSTELRIQPIDYMGENTLEPGRYTYRLYFHEGYLQLDMTRDDQ